MVAQLKEVESTDRARLSEYIFKNVFIPMFAGDKDLMYQVTIENWIKVAGNPYKSVDIVDNNNKVLFTVPPPFNRDAINPVSNDDVPLAHVVKSAQQYANIAPAQGLHYLNAELTKRALVMKTATHVMNNLEAWNAIFARYGREPILRLNETEAVNPAQPGNNKGSDDYDFEPL